MPYRVTVAGEIARLREGDAGTRNVRINKGTPEDRILTFSRLPTYLATLPLEVERDAMLVVKEISEEEMVKAGGRLLGLVPEAEPEEPPQVVALAEDEDDLEEEPPVEDELIVTEPADPDKVNKSNMKRPRRTAARRGRKA